MLDGTPSGRGIDCAVPASATSRHRLQGGEQPNDADRLDVRARRGRATTSRSSPGPLEPLHDHQHHPVRSAGTHFNVDRDGLRRVGQRQDELRGRRGSSSGISGHSARGCGTGGTSPCCPPSTEHSARGPARCRDRVRHRRSTGRNGTTPVTGNATAVRRGTSIRPSRVDPERGDCAADVRFSRGSRRSPRRLQIINNAVGVQGDGRGSVLGQPENRATTSPWPSKHRPPQLPAPAGSTSFTPGAHVDDQRGRRGDLRQPEHRELRPRLHPHGAIVRPVSPRRHAQSSAAFDIANDVNRCTATCTAKP